MFRWFRSDNHDDRNAVQGAVSETPAVANDQPVIRFLCEPDWLGIIPQPLPARKVLPDWFKALPAVDKAALSASDNGLTIKRCMPFLDAMTTGWIIPLAATVRLEVADNGTCVDCGWEIDRTMISNHSAPQVAGHPKMPSPPMKFHNHWTIVTPPGWSCLFVPPLNRSHPGFDILSGIVDTDTYKSPVHFPFFPPSQDGVHVFEAGTPLMQVIPFRRDASALAMECEIGAEDEDAAAERERILKLTMVRDGWYRTEARAPR